MHEFSNRHRARLVAALREVDESLVGAARVLDPAALHSPLSGRIDDVTAVQRRLIVDYAERVRSAVRAILARHAISPPQSGESALVAARTALDRAVIAVEELAPRYMLAHGALSYEAEADLNRIVSQLLGLLEQMCGCLDAARRNDPRLRIERVPAQRERAVLTELTRLVEAHNLARLRQPLAALVERYESNDLEVAAFGRVNSGKSSLLNYFLQAPILPVGATPVTAVPVSLTYGAAAWGFATFADAAPEKFALERLQEFAAEHFNPSNRRHATRLRVELPAPQLRGGITLTDMPGRVFAEATDTQAILGVETLCDIGLVLIDAAAGLTLEEAVIVDMLQRAGSSVLVLLTKADLLPAEERWKIQGHIAHGLSAMTGRDVEVYFASTLAADAALRDDWLERGLLPLLRLRGQLRESSLRSKLGALADAASAALERRLAFTTGRAAAPEAWDAADAGLAEARAMLDVARNEAFDAWREADRQTTALVNEVAYNAALLWPQSHEPSLDITTLLAESLRARATGGGKAVAGSLRSLRARCSIALATAAALVGTARAEATDLPVPVPLPPFEGARAVKATILRQPAFAFLGCRRRCAAARKRLARSPVRVDIAGAMTEHFRRVEEWRLRALEELSEALADRSAALRAQHRERASAPERKPSAEAQALAADLEKLRRFRTHSNNRAEEHQA